MEKYRAPEYLVCFIKKEKDDENGTGDYKVIRAQNPFFLKDKILAHMKKGGYISFFFAKRGSIGDIDALNYATHNCD